MKKIVRSKSHRKTRKRFRDRLLLLAAGIALGAIGYFFILGEVGVAVDRRGYDALLRMTPARTVPEDIVIIAIDDPAVDAVGSWPWPRDQFADGLLDLKSLGARHVVVDVTYPNPSRSVRAEPSSDGEDAGRLIEDLAALTEAIESGRIGEAGAARALRQLLDGASGAGGALQTDARTETPDNPDEYLGNVLSAIGSSVIAVTWQPGTPSSRDDVLAGQSSLPEVVLSEDAEVPVAGAVVPAVEPIQQGARSVGFVNTVVDPDGVKRRTHLVVEVNGQYLPGLGIAPLVLDGFDQFTVSPEEITLSRGQEQRMIDRAPDGSILIRWHRGQLEEGFEVLSYRAVVEMWNATNEMVTLLRAMERAGYLSVLPGGPTLFVPLEEAQSLRREMVATGNPSLMALYGPRMETFVSDAGRILSEESEQIILGIIDEGPQSEQTQAIRDEVISSFAAARVHYEDLVAIRSTLTDAVAGSTVFLGFTAASTTDIGVTPFEEEYLNIGMHAAVLSTVLSESELDSLPQSWGAYLFLAAIALITLLVLFFPPRTSIVVGLTVILLQVGGAVVLFLLLSLYLPFASSGIMSFVAFALLTALSYVLSERDKQQIRLAFEHYLAPDIISELLEDPQKLDVGGESRVMTAMFTDVEQFASAIDKLPPQSVVELLGEYLKEMTGPILDERGTIDKYEGDAIVAFFGAPLDDTLHARHACDAAVKMRQLEPTMNDRLVRSGVTSVPLRTRMGIHTGPMTVGNLGTEDRLDYTIIGAEVNLASRLEHVNKQYGTYLIISDETYRAAGEGLLVRKMDRVRVVGIDRPVRLYELLGHAGDSTSALREALDLFEDGLVAFESREWEAARDHFKTVLRIYPQDGPAKVMIERCDRFLLDPPRESWDGITNLTEK